MCILSALRHLKNSGRTSKKLDIYPGVQRKKKKAEMKKVEGERGEDRVLNPWKRVLNGKKRGPLSGETISAMSDGARKNSQMKRIPASRNDVHDGSRVPFLTKLFLSLSLKKKKRKN